jgi:hypothetical protein
MSLDKDKSEPTNEPSKDASKDAFKDAAQDHSASHSGHDEQAPATDIIPENSPQDLLLKCVTIVAAVLISGTFLWWYSLPLAPAGEGHGGAETVEH